MSVLFTFSILWLAAYSLTRFSLHQIALMRDVKSLFEYTSIDVEVEIPQGQEIDVRSTYQIKETDLRVKYSTRVVCVYPSDELRITEIQNGESYYPERTFAGYADDELPEGFNENERNIDRRWSIYKWWVNDIPPIGSTCHVSSQPYTMLFYGGVRKDHPEMESNKFTIIEPLTEADRIKAIKSE